MSRTNVHFALGKAYDDLGDYAEAMRHYEEANRLRAMSARLDRPALVAKYDSIIAGFTAEALERASANRWPRPAAPGDDLPVFILGMPRSGTALVEQILSAHSRDRRGRRAGLLGGAGATRGAGPARPPPAAACRSRGPRPPTIIWLCCAGSDPAAQRVTDKAPGNFMRIGLILHAVPEGAHHSLPAQSDRHLPVDLLRVFHRPDGFLRRSRRPGVFYRQYGRLMAHWRSAAAENYETEYEKLVNDREAGSRELIAFCGLDWDDACLAPEQNDRQVRTASVWQARQPVYKTPVERWRRYEPWLGELRELVPKTGATRRGGRPFPSPF